MHWVYYHCNRKFYKDKDSLAKHTGGKSIDEAKNLEHPKDDMRRLIQNEITEMRKQRETE